MADHAAEKLASPRHLGHLGHFGHLRRFPLGLAFSILIQTSAECLTEGINESKTSWTFLKKDIPCEKQLLPLASSMFKFPPIRTAPMRRMRRSCLRTSYADSRCIRCSSY